MRIQNVIINDGVTRPSHKIEEEKSVLAIFHNKILLINFSLLTCMFFTFDWVPKWFY